MRISDLPKAEMPISDLRKAEMSISNPPKAEMSTSDLPKAEMSISDPLRQECQFLTSLRRKCRPLEVSREHSDLQRTGRPAENKIAYGSDFKTAVRIPLSVRGRCLVVRIEI